MHVDIMGQALVFGQGVLLGVALGLVYDGMRTLRRSLKLAALAFLLDLLFWVGTAASLFALTLLSDDGQVRIFHIAAVALGGGLYFLTLSKLILPFLLWLADRIRALFRLFTAPIRRAGRAGKKFLKFQKKHFQNWLAWYKINILYRFTRNGEGERQAMKLKRAGMATKLLVLVLLAIVAVALLSTQAKLSAAQADRDALIRQVQQQQEANAALQDGIDHSDDPEYLADIARSRLGLVGPGEIEFVDSSK